MDKQLFFIGCSPRTGSTLLIRILNCHSKISAPCEITIKRYFIGDMKVAQKMAFDKHDKICRYYGVNEIIAEENPSELFQTILQKEKKTHLVIKHPRHAMFFEQLRCDFPGAKFIHLIRDVRSVAMTSFFKEQPEVGMERWYQYNRSILDALDKTPHDQQHCIRYEDLVEEPEATVTKLVTFLGFNFEPQMLDYNNYPHADNSMELWNNNSPQDSPLHQNLNIGKITNSVKDLRERYDDESSKIYEKNAKVKELNQRLGY